MWKWAAGYNMLDNLIKIEKIFFSIIWLICLCIRGEMCTRSRMRKWRNTLIFSQSDEVAMDRLASLSRAVPLPCHHCCLYSWPAANYHQMIGCSSTETAVVRKQQLPTDLSLPPRSFWRMLDQIGSHGGSRGPTGQAPVPKNLMVSACTILLMVHWPKPPPPPPPPPPSSGNVGRGCKKAWMLRGMIQIYLSSICCGYVCNVCMQSMYVKYVYM